ncbi:MAG: hypothetical protein GC202_08255 [Alphaproteobacteria bacterium]|nr:hypothetical protein [Alphaproteobacteria bacterium]
MISSRRDFLKIAGIAMPAAALAACGDAPKLPQFPPLTYASLGRFTFEAERFEIAQDYKPPLAPPNVEHLFQQRPTDALRQWATDRLAVTGRGERYVRFVIIDAHVTETELPRATGVRATFTNEQAQRYDGRIEAAIEVRQIRGNFRDGFATAAATRSRTVAEDITLNDREGVWYDMVQQMMTDVNAELDRQIRANMQRFMQL